MAEQPPIPGTLGDPVPPDGIVSPRPAVWVEVRAALMDARERKRDRSIPVPPPAGHDGLTTRWCRRRWWETLAWARQYGLSSAIRELCEDEVILTEEPVEGAPIPNDRFVCPRPHAWDEIYQRLLREREARGDPKVPRPPIALILNGWAFSTWEMRRQRWLDQVRWADRYGFTHAIPDLYEDDVVVEPDLDW